jgi:hypothetical protein
MKKTEKYGSIANGRTSDQLANYKKDYPKNLTINLTKTEVSIIIEELYTKIEEYQNFHDVTDEYLEKLIRLYQKIKDTTI